MMDLISRQAAINTAFTMRCRCDTNDIDDYANMILEALEVLPTIELIDAAPVVRCKDCKHSELWHSDRRRCFLWCETGNSVWDDGYCSYGERSEEC